MSNISIEKSLSKENNHHVFKIKFSDNQYIMQYKSLDVMDVLKVKNTIETRIEKFFNGQCDILKTSDIKGLEYIKKELI